MVELVRSAYEGLFLDSMTLVTDDEMSPLTDGLEDTCVPLSRGPHLGLIAAFRIEDPDTTTPGAFTVHAAMKNYGNSRLPDMTWASTSDGGMDMVCGKDFRECEASFDYENDTMSYWNITCGGCGTCEAPMLYLQYQELPWIVGRNPLLCLVVQ